MRSPTDAERSADFFSIHGCRWPQPHSRVNLDTLSFRHLAVESTRSYRQDRHLAKMPDHVTLIAVRNGQMRRWCTLESGRCVSRVEYRRTHAAEEGAVSIRVPRFWRLNICCAPGCWLDCKHHESLKVKAQSPKHVYKARVDVFDPADWLLTALQPQGAHPWSN